MQRNIRTLEAYKKEEETRLELEDKSVKSVGQDDRRLALVTISKRKHLRINEEAIIEKQNTGSADFALHALHELWIGSQGHESLQRKLTDFCVAVAL